LLLVGVMKTLINVDSVLEFGVLVLLTEKEMMKIKIMITITITITTMMKMKIVMMKITMKIMMKMKIVMKKRIMFVILPNVDVLVNLNNLGALKVQNYNQAGVDKAKKIVNLAMELGAKNE